MESQRIGVTIVALLVSIGIILVLPRLKNSGQRQLYTIGILQTISHPALDMARKGFMITMQKKMGDNIDFIIRNGQGSISNIHTAAQQFHIRQDIDAIFTIATPAAQAMASVEKEKPIIIAAVSVVPELEDIFSAANVCGMSDMINVSKEVAAMKEILPETIKSVGIIFCSAEINSVAMSRQMVTELHKEGYQSQLFAITSESDIEPVVLSAIRKVDALLAPTDNVIASSIALIADLAARAEKPLIVSDNLLVQHGALMARGIDYYESGIQAAEIALQIITQDKRPQDIAIMKADNKDIYVNKPVLDQFGYTISENIKKDVVFVGP